LFLFFISERASLSINLDDNNSQYSNNNVNQARIGINFSSCHTF